MTQQKQKSYITGLLKTENEQLCRLHDLVEKALQEKTLMMENLQNPPQEMLTPGQLVSDKVARFGGSWVFILSFLGVLTLWIIFNLVTPLSAHFDPYPFILLNLVLSCVAALQAPIIMMSQNRKEEKDRQRAENDYLVNLKSELEIRNLHQKIDLLLEEQMQQLMEVQVAQLKLLEKINQKK